MIKAYNAGNRIIVKMITEQTSYDVLTLPQAIDFSKQVLQACVELQIKTGKSPEDALLVFKNALVICDKEARKFGKGDLPNFREN